MTLIAVDFDGTLTDYAGHQDWVGADKCINKPKPGAIEWLRSVMSWGYTIGIYSARNHQPGGIACIGNWLMENGLTEEEVQEIEIYTHKPPAVLLVDDRAWGWPGRLPTHAELEEWGR